MGYIDHLRGKYPDSDEQFKVLKIYLGEMTCEERMRLSNESFYDLWFSLWSNHSSKLYINEYENAEKIFMKLDIKDLLSKTTYIPHEELFVGTNGIQYRHIYYVSEISAKDVSPRDKIETIRDGGEIFNIGWFTFDQCMKVIRPYDTAKKRLLEEIHRKFEHRYN
ncbi:hypothetical protein BDK51DRAFT_26863 [Blyttiomyces helicus]|uniref:Nudix hydrolase domain-containing protein n=1 Tax=Blyttiomyces helicus TaxID=388810 RepID=A0A4P9WRQ3_9FUNG|nr:hypothetical protein BDK51DRAFT_26863 [Blyttiomyces helicus]|eukprot:RKO94578.1 hypothetical protein BDK51DRAFT_26863 [Blyttiomyces helicus]